MKKLVIANWKCNPTTSKDAQKLLNSIKQGIGDLQNTQVVICPPFVWLPVLGKDSAFAKGFGGLAFGSQNCFWEQSGAFTGEISPEMLKNLGCEYVILGHSERRRNLRETDEMIEKKLKAAFEADLKPILCIGENQEQRSQNKTQEVLKSRLSILNDSMARSLSHLILVYEPVWAVSTTNGMAATPKDAQQILLFLKKQFTENASPSTPILYGGSVDSKNATDYIKIGFDGLLVGATSLNAQEFIKIIQSLEKK